MTISISDVDQAEAALAEAKQAFFADRENPGLAETFEAAKKDVVEKRMAWRQQEEAAGTRQGFVGGDAVAEG